MNWSSNLEIIGINNIKMQSQKPGIEEKRSRDFMRNTPIVSIVIPVFNVEQYLDECMESILRQSYSKLDIVLVDDGSQD